jgi:DNA invertase Pin-like site-specific DNA recombinase
MSTARTATPRVYSYLRFSSPEQAGGDSERRQRGRFAAARDYAHRKGLEFDETLDLNDRGLSAYSGAHRKKGAMGRFLRLVEAGRIAPRSALMVEDIDRLSREGPGKALRQIIFKLWDHDITLATADPPAEYAPGCETDPQFLLLIVLLNRGFEESQRKSRTIGAAKAAARNGARAGQRLLTRVAPKWLRVNGAGTFEPIPEAAATLRQIFDWYLNGLGSCAIEKKLNATAAWSPPHSPKRKSTGWRRSYIRKILASRTVIGELQPCRRVNGRHVPEGEPIAAYYPAVVPPEVFFAAQQRLAANRGKGGRTGLARNLFGHLATCAYCGGPMAYALGGPRRDTGGGERFSRLVCDRGRRGAGCRAHAMRYDEVESVVLSNLPGLRPEDILPTPTDAAREVQALRERLAGHEAEAADVEQRADNLVDQIERTQDRAIRARYEQRLGELHTRKAELETAVNEDRQRLAAAERGRQAVEEWQRDLAALTAALAGGDPEVRLKARSHLRELIDRVEVFGSGHRAVYRFEDLAAAFDHVVGPAVAAAYARGVREGEAYLDPAVQEALERAARDPDFVDVACERDTAAENIRFLAPRAGWPEADLPAFTDYVLKRRLSKEGRFVRCHFRAGVSADLVPEGSLASGWRLARGTDPQNVRPDYRQLWQDFQAGKSGDRVRVRRKVKPVRPLLS